ncbi:MAG: [FeFe] hydrogenase H-cluster radical SAM maturase HydE [Planctomycetota bacterium]|nr:[FeFe] hydrogenase H-cluster radical SAM maturase HydE [Planctomycetota bacterium]
MCYAIPGKITGLDGRVATVDYYGEKRNAYIDLVPDLTIGSYVYAQGGFVVSRISEAAAQDILKDWRELFFKLQETDRRLSNDPKTLYERANAIRQKHQGNSCCIHGILEFSNYCARNCHYCGIRRDNKKLTRYRLDTNEILEAVDYASNKLGFKALVLQSGEDVWYTDDKLHEIVTEIRKRCPVLIFVSIGERDLSTFKRLYDAGARGVLLRFETSDEALYSRLKPDSKLKTRLEMLKALREMGYLIITGFLVGLPKQKGKDILESIKLTAELGAEMFSFGPFIPHPETPLSGAALPSLEQMLKTIARARLTTPDARILVTTALETLDKENGARQGLMAGANSLMINVTPLKYRKLYDIYPNRAGVEDDTNSRIDSVLKLLYLLGRAPTDLGVALETASKTMS